MPFSYLPFQHQIQSSYIKVEGCIYKCIGLFIFTSVLSIFCPDELSSFLLHLRRKEQCQITKSENEKTPQPDSVIFRLLERYLSFCGSWSHLKDKSFIFLNLENYQYCSFHGILSWSVRVYIYKELKLDPSHHVLAN